MIVSGIYDCIELKDLGNILGNKVSGIITFVEPNEEHSFAVCGQAVLLSDAFLADAISVSQE